MKKTSKPRMTREQVFDDDRYVNVLRFLDAASRVHKPVGLEHLRRAFVIGEDAAGLVQEFNGSEGIVNLIFSQPTTRTLKRVTNLSNVILPNLVWHNLVKKDTRRGRKHTYSIHPGVIPEFYRYLAKARLDSVKAKHIKAYDVNDGRSRILVFGIGDDFELTGQEEKVVQKAVDEIEKQVRVIEGIKVSKIAESLDAVRRAGSAFGVSIVRTRQKEDVLELFAEYNRRRVKKQNF